MADRNGVTEAEIYPPRAFPASTIESVTGTLLRAMDGLPFGAGAARQVLYATDKVNDIDQIADARLPALILAGFDFASTPETGDDKDIVDLVLRAILKVKAPKAGAGSAAMRRAIDSILELATAVRGLPVDEDGEVQRWNERTPWRYDAGEIRDLVDIAGPFVRAGQIVELPGTPYAQATLTIALKFYRVHAARETYKVRVPVVGLRLLNRQLDLDGYSVLSPIALSDAAAITRYDTEAPDLAPATFGDPPFPGGDNEVGHLPGLDPSMVIVSIALLPRVVAIAVGAERQLAAQATYLDGSAREIGFNNGVAWATSNGAVATVSIDGLVKGESAGAATITGSRNGIAASSVSVTVS